MEKVKFKLPWTDNKVLELEGNFQVCKSCRGHGRTDRTDIDTSRLYDSMVEDGDHEGIQDYWNGDYSQVCDRCNGQRVSVEINWDLYPQLHKKLIEHNREEAEYQAICAAERAFGA